ncbi:arabinofuranosidase catalytic domain-containing protein [Streptomyces sp. OfavH-34-F]|uniref:arabinofuranosidase catalytic domain-containing protein n=1 Tax=Streptomyces sp. OfavH-34-F TaxID=2917760 RepID=UPI0035B21D9B
MRGRVQHHAGAVRRRQRTALPGQTRLGDVLTSGYPSRATEDAVQANITAAGYASADSVLDGSYRRRATRHPAEQPRRGSPALTERACLPFL